MTKYKMQLSPSLQTESGRATIQATQNAPLAHPLNRLSHRTTTRSSTKNLGTLTCLFDVSGEVRNDKTVKYNFKVTQKTESRLYFENELDSAPFNDRRVFVDLFDKDGDKIKAMNVDPNEIDSFTATLAKGNYTLKISTPSKETGDFQFSLLKI